jgi:hypothetical protein
MTDAKLASLQHLPLPDAIRTLRRSLTDLEQLIDTHIPEEEREAFRRAIAPILAKHRADAAGLDELEVKISAAAPAQGTA